MPDTSNSSGPPLTRKNYTPAFNAECVRQVAAGARQTDVARAQGLWPALRGRWQRQALAEAGPSRAEHAELKRLRAELKRVEQECDSVKKVNPSLPNRLRHESLAIHRAGSNHRAGAGALPRATG